jgi:hypothetical protein
MAEILIQHYTKSGQMKMAEIISKASNLLLVNTIIKLAIYHFSLQRLAGL